MVPIREERSLFEERVCLASSERLDARSSPPSRMIMIVVIRVMCFRLHPGNEMVEIAIGRLER